VRGFVSPPIGEALAFDPGHDGDGALIVADAKGGAAVVAEGELGKVAMEVGFAAMLRDTLMPRLRTENTFSTLLMVTNIPAS
jgi:hypothetical protein